MLHVSDAASVIIPNIYYNFQVQKDHIIQWSYCGKCLEYLQVSVVLTHLLQKLMYIRVLRFLCSSVFIFFTQATCHK